MWQHFCLIGRIIGKKKMGHENIEVFFSYYSACEANMLPHQPLNGSLKY
jgi:hypothetical protein